MAKLELAILKHFGDGEGKVVLSYDEENFKKKLVSSVNGEILSASRMTKRKFNADEIRGFVESAFDSLLTEFKSETVRVR